MRKEVGQGVFEVICDQLATPFRDSPLAISFNIQEFHPELNYKRNNLHEHVRARAADATSSERIDPDGTNTRTHAGDAVS